MEFTKVSTFLGTVLYTIVHKHGQFIKMSMTPEEKHQIRIDVLDCMYILV